MQFQTEYTVQIYVNTGFAYEYEAYGSDEQEACDSALEAFYYAIDCAGMPIDIFESDLVTACILSAENAYGNIVHYS